MVRDTHHNVFGVDVRSIGYPGLISWSSPPVAELLLCGRYFHKALADKKKYECFLSSNKMPMMYMDDAIAATIKIMQAN
jgi:hypothetical protein